MAGRSLITRDEAMRVDALAMRCGGMKHAAIRLGVGLCTVEIAIEQGRMMRVTRDRLIAALEREEAAG